MLNSVSSLKCVMFLHLGFYASTIVEQREYYSG